MSDQKKTALVTGGSKGIGFGVAKTLLKMGYNVGITSRKLQAAEEAASELSEFGEVLPLEADVRSYESQQQAVEKLVNQFGSLDVLVANAGIGKFGSIEDMSPDDWNTTIDTNLTGVFYSVKASVTELKKTEGYIIIWERK